MEIITGIVGKITYQNEENGYSVIKIRDFCRAKRIV